METVQAFSLIAAANHLRHLWCRHCSSVR